MLRNRIFPLAVVLCGAVMAMYPVRASAQIISDVEADIPFKFIVRSTTLAPGKYTIRPLDNTENTMEIVSADGRAAVMFLTNAAQAKTSPAKTELEFNKHGDQEFLSKIFVEGEKDGVQLEKSRMEEKLDKNGPTHTIHRQPAKRIKHAKPKVS